MLTFCFSGAEGKMTEMDVLTSGMVGKQVRLEFSSAWEGLIKTLVFSAGDVSRDVVFAGETAVIPAEVLKTPMEELYVGVWGVSADGELVIPTIRARGPVILPGTEPSGDPGTDPELAVWAQLQVQMGDPAGLETEAKDSLVSAVNELSQRTAAAGENGATFTPSLSADGTLSWTNDKGLDNPESVCLMGPQGEKGERGNKGDPGADGAPGADARIVAQGSPPEDTAVLWVDTGDDSGDDIAFANPLAGKYITLNGDSICAGSGDTLGGYGKIIAGRNGMTCQNIAQGGGTITAELYSDSTGNPYHWISRTIPDMDAAADYAIVEGGVNDHWKPAPLGALTSGYSAELDDTTFYGAFESMLRQLIERFPGKKIGYLIVHRTYAEGMWPGGDYHTAAVECCEKWGVPYLDLTVEAPPLGPVSALRSAYTVDGDGTHPTAEGYEKFYCGRIESWLRSL